MKSFLHRFICLSIFLAQGALALPPWVTDSPEYRALLADLLLESEQFDGFKETKSEVAQFQKAFKSLLGTSGLSAALPEGQSWNAVWPPEAWQASLHSQSGSIQVRRVNVTPEAKHSIHNTESFVKNRLGTKVVELAKKNEIAVDVLAGNNNSLSQIYNGKQIVEVPSFYASWGIKKYFINTAGKPTLAFLIPPIREYVDHYGAMFKVVGVNASLRLDETARLKMRSTFLNEMNNLSKVFPLQGSHVVFGYTRQFEQALTPGEYKGWKVASTVNFSTAGEMGIFGKAYILKNKYNQVARVVTLGAEATLWGEATQFFAEGVLTQKPASLSFLGSAGSLSGKGDIYGASVPKAFLLNGKTIPVTNELNALLQKRAHAMANLNTVHGHSVSPAEQYETFVKNTVASGVDTVDVETNLVAKAVSEHNAKNAQKVKLLVANLITDKPYYLQRDSVQDLDNVDPVKKQSARLNIVDLTLTTQEQLPISTNLPPIDMAKICLLGVWRDLQ